MALRTIPASREEEAQLRARFQIAQDTPPEDIEQRKRIQGFVRDDIHSVADFIDKNVENGPTKEQALIHLEEALMWAGKAIFS